MSARCSVLIRREHLERVRCGVIGLKSRQVWSYLPKAFRKIRVGLAGGFTGTEVTFNIVSQVFLLCMVFLVTTDVAGRYFLNKPLPGTYELTQCLMIAIVFLPLAYVQRMRRHVAVEFVVSRLSAKVRLIFETTVLSLGIFLFGLLVWRSYWIATVSVEIAERSMGRVAWPYYPWRIILVLGVFLMLVRLVLDLTHTIRALREKRRVI